MKLLCAFLLAIPLFAVNTLKIDQLWLPGGTIGVAYSQTFTAHGGVAPYTFAVTAGSLPTSVTMATPTISGTPTVANTFTFTITVTDSTPVTALTFAIQYSVRILALADFALDSYGPSPAWQGYGGGVMSITATWNAGNTAHLYLNSITGVPAGVTANFWCSTVAPIGNANCFTESPAPHRKFQFNNNNLQIGVELRFTATKVATPGTYTIVATFASPVNSGADVTHTVTVSLSVRAPTYITPNTTLVSGAITNLATWESTMTTLATKWAITNFVPSNWTWSLAGETFMWYYDGAWVMYRVADYTRDPSWIGPAQIIADYYGHAHPLLDGRGWHMFPEGMDFAIIRKAPETQLAGEFMGAINWMALTSPYAVYAGIMPSHLFLGGQTAARDPGQRETSQLLMGILAYQRQGGNSASLPTIAGRTVQAELVDRLIMGLYMETVGNTVVLEQGIYDAFASQALIQYYQHTGDPRIPEVIKLWLDYAWANLINNATGEWKYDPFNRGYQCDGGCANDTDFTDTTLLLWDYLPAFGWYYALTGDTTYRTRGDLAFNACTPPPDTGKEFTQNYRWSFDYVRWRTKGLP